MIDGPEVQVRLYGRDGSLRTVIGRRGEGPGEFETPVSASRAMDGRIVVADPSLSRITFFSPEGAFENLVGNVPVRLLWDVKDLGADRLLLLGPGGDDVGQPRFLHIWDAQADRVERRFLPMGLPVASRPAGLSFPAVRHGEVDLRGGPGLPPQLRSRAVWDQGGAVSHSRPGHLA